jgi:hypothetical protein
MNTGSYDVVGGEEAGPGALKFEGRTRLRLLQGALLAQGKKLVRNGSKVRVSASLVSNPEHIRGLH